MKHRVNHSVCALAPGQPQHWHTYVLLSVGPAMQTTWGWGGSGESLLLVSTLWASLFSTTYILQIWRAVDFRHVYTKHSCWLCWDLQGRINTVHQSHIHLTPSCPSDTDIEYFQILKTFSIPLPSRCPQWSHHYTISFLFCSVQAAVPRHSSSVLYSPSGHFAPDTDCEGIFMWFGGETHVTTPFCASKHWDGIQCWFRSSPTPNWFNLSPYHHAGAGLCLPGKQMVF